MSEENNAASAPVHQLVGPDLDRAVAAEVMGWSYEPEFGLMNGERFVEVDGTWSPSSNIAHAWEVVEKLSAVDQDCRYGKMEIRSPALKPECGHAWMCTFQAYLASDLDDYGHGETAPLAICRAALMRVRGDRANSTVGQRDAAQPLLGGVNDGGAKC